AYWYYGTLAHRVIYSAWIFIRDRVPIGSKIYLPIWGSNKRTGHEIYGVHFVRHISKFCNRSSDRLWIEIGFEIYDIIPIFMGILLTINLNMMKIAVKMLCIIFLLSLSKNIWAQESVDKGLQALVDDYKAVGLAVVVIKDNQPIYQKALGYKNLESQTPLRTDHLFRIASISKSFSATAIMQLVEKGLISLDDDFGDLMGFPIRNPK